MTAYVPAMTFRKVRARPGMPGLGLKAIRLRDWLALRRIMRRTGQSADALVPPMDTFHGKGSSLSDPTLARLLAHDELGTWALDVATIEVIWEKLQAERPNVVVEFGAGVSTVVLARYAQWRRSQGLQRPAIISIEQDATVRDKTHARLESVALSEGVHVLHAPLSAASHYQLNLDDLRNRLDGRPIEWVLIDGPAGPEGCRVSTLLDIMPLCADGARWFLDDALRDGELDILRKWSRIRDIAVEGIYPVGKGLACGTVDRSNSARRA